MFFMNHSILAILSIYSINIINKFVEKWFIKFKKFKLFKKINLNRRFCDYSENLIIFFHPLRLHFNYFLLILDEFNCFIFSLFFIDVFTNINGSFYII